MATYFDDSWISTYLWVKRVQDNPKLAYCVYCEKKIQLSNMAKSSLISHQSGKKHERIGNSRRIAHKIDIFAQPTSAGT